MSRASAPWVFDADGHVIEPPRVWDELLPEKFRDYAPRVLQYDGYYHYACGDRLSFRIPGRAEAMGAPGQTPMKSDTPVAVRGGRSRALVSTTWPSTPSRPPLSIPRSAS
jgi:hypothetical protein